MPLSKLKKIILYVYPLLLVLLAGCSTAADSDQYVIEVQKRVGSEDKFEEFQRITNEEEIAAVTELLDETKWSQGRFIMSRPADYKFRVVAQNPETEDKAVDYEMWVRPYTDKVEVMWGGNNHAYTDPATMLGIIAGDEEHKEYVMNERRMPYPFWIILVVVSALAILSIMLEKWLHKRLKIKKGKLSDTPGKRADSWGRGIIAILFVMAMSFFTWRDNEQEIYWVLILYITISGGFQAYMEWKYFKGSKQYLTTLIVPAIFVPTAILLFFL